MVHLAFFSRPRHHHVRESPTSLSHLDWRSCWRCPKCWAVSASVRRAADATARRSPHLSTVRVGSCPRPARRRGWKRSSTRDGAPPGISCTRSFSGNGNWSRWIESPTRPRLARRVRIGLVIARDDTDFPPIFEAHLGRSENMAGGVKGELHAMQRNQLAVWRCFDRRRCAQARLQHGLARRCREILAAAGPGMIGVRMREHGPRYRAPRVDAKVPGSAIQPPRSFSKEGLGRSVRAR